jgi:recombination protein RecA
MKKNDVDAIMATDPIETAKNKGKQLKSAAFGRLMNKMEGWKPAPEVLLSVRSVPTIFPQFDWVTGVGGLPLERVVVVTGPSNHGKSAFALGLASSFVQSGHLAGYEDAEQTTTVDWARELMREFADDPRFMAMRPTSYEAAVEATNVFCHNIADAREAGDLPEGAGGVVIVDSLRKLVPEKIMKEINKDSLGSGIDGMNGRAGQIRALYNGAWLDILVPLMASTGCTVVLIVREVDDPNADPWDKKFGNDFKITGGKSLIYESSLLLRITRAGWVTDGKKKDEGGDGKIYGERHKVTILKTKVAGKEERTPSGFFHTSNGLLVPAGFDRARDVIDLAIKFDIVKVNGSWYSYGPDRLGQGLNNAVETLASNEVLLDTIEKACRTVFADHSLSEAQEA